MVSWRSEFGTPFSGKRVLVTGATGFIGKYLCEALVELGAEVHGTSRSGSVRRTTGGVKLWQVDLTDLQSTQDVISQVHPHLIYHLAGMVTAQQALELIFPMLYTNLVGTINVLLSAKAERCQRVVVTGSAEEPSVPGEIPTSPYAAAKYSATLYSLMFFRLYDLPVVVARLFMGYGPGQDQNKLVPYVIRSLLQGNNPKLSNGDRICDFIYVLDIVRGLLLLGLRGGVDGRIVDLGSGRGTSVREIVDLLVELIGCSAKPQFGALPDRLGERSCVADIATTQALLDWTPAWSLQDGLRCTIDWIKQEMENAAKKS